MSRMNIMMLESVLILFYDLIMYINELVVNISMPHDDDIVIMSKISLKWKGSSLLNNSNSSNTLVPILSMNGPLVQESKMACDKIFFTKLTEITMEDLLQMSSWKVSEKLASLIAGLPNCETRQKKKAMTIRVSAHFAGTTSNPWFASK